MLLLPEKLADLIGEAAGVPTQTLDQAGRVSCGGELSAKVNPLFSSLFLQRLFADLSFDQHQPRPFILHDSHGLCFAAFPLTEDRNSLRVLGPATMITLGRHQLADICSHYRLADANGLTSLLESAVIPLKRFVALAALAFYAEWGLLYAPAFLAEQANYIQYDDEASLAQNYADFEFTVRETGVDLNQQAKLEQEYREAVLSGNYDRGKALLPLMVTYYRQKPAEICFSAYRDSITTNHAYLIKEAVEHNLMPAETASLMFGAFRAAVSKIKTIDEAYQFYQEMTRDLCTRVSFTKNNYTKPVTNCRDYIRKNLHSNITLAKLAEITHLSPNYLSRLFKKEMGVSVIQCITNERVKAAKNLLLYSDYSIVDISSILAFSSQGYFSTVFRKATGMTPQNYRLHFSKGNRPL